MRRDISYPQMALLALLCCLLVGLAWGLSTSGGAFDPYDDDWDGGSELRTGLASEGTSVTVALSTDAYTETEPRETAAVVLEPGDRYGPAERAQLSSFLAQGGTLVVAASTNETNDLLSGLDSAVRLDGAPVRDEQRNYRNPALVRADDVANETLTRDVDALTLNHGTVLAEGDATRLVNTSATAYLDRNRNEELDSDEELGSRPVATVETRGAGQLVVVSDASVFTNAMLEQDGNRQFLHNLAEGHEHAVLDYSQSASLSPLTYAFVALRTSSLLQVAVGVLGIGTVALWGRRDVVSRLWPRTDPGTEPGESRLREETLAAHLRERHPEWDDERRQRVTKAIIRQRQQEEDND